MVLDSSTDAAIKRAMIRATARNIQATPIDAVTTGYDRTVYYQVGAFSHTGSHRVALHYTADGVTAVCDCEAGQNERICHHVAAALMAEEMPQVEPDEPTMTNRQRAFILLSRAHDARDYAGIAHWRRVIDAIDDAARALKAPPIPANFISDLMNPGAF